MSRLILLRHGQASFLAEDYDKLSPLGQQQARQLGAYWLQHPLRVDEVYCGPRQRHRETADELRQAYQRAGVAWPDPLPLAEFDEHQVDQLVREHGAELVARVPALDGLFAAYRGAQTPSDKHRGFQRLFEAVVECWRQGEPLGVESWPDFQRRVNAGLDQLVGRPGHNRVVLVVTSVGPVSVALQRALGCSDQTALQTGWRLWNGSLTEFMFSGDRFTLDVFNALPHVSPAKRTYR
jgi:broad specificity phosphatase PhoE